MRGRAAVAGMLVAAAGAAEARQLAPAAEPIQILGFRREQHGDSVHLVVGLSAPVEYNYRSSDQLSVQIELLGVDPTGVSAPTEAWGTDVDAVSLSQGPSPTSALLELELKRFVPYRVGSAGRELFVVLNPPPIASVARAEPPAEGEPAVAPTPRPEPAPAAEPPFEPGPPARPEPEPATPPEPEPVTPEPVTPPEPEPVTPAKPEPIAPPPTADPSPGATEDVVSAPPDAPAPPAGPRATRIFEASRADREGWLAVRVAADGVPDYSAFFTEDLPHRLVVDVEGTQSRPLFSRLAIGVGPVQRVRIGQHAAEPMPVVRIVFDLAERVPHRIEADAEGLTVIFHGVAASGGDD